MSDLCLSRDEIRAMTRTPFRARQAAFLKANGIRHYLDAHGWPVVLRSSVEGSTAAKPAPAWTPRKAANG
jgi:hypothetical protein